jgi:hypothetical protein
MWQRQLWGSARLIRPGYAPTARRGRLANLGHPSCPFTAQHNRNTPRVDRHILTIKMNKYYRCVMVELNTDILSRAEA